MRSLRDVAFALPATDTAAGGWSLAAASARPIWPDVAHHPVSGQELCRRFAKPGAALRTLAAGTANVWDQIDRNTLVTEIRDRLRDPALVRQRTTDLCGPMSIVFELARRNPARYVKVVDHLLATGEIEVDGDDPIEAEQDLRERPAPPNVAQVDWLLAATMRDDANITEDVDDGAGLEGLTLWGAMRDWSRDILRQKHTGWETCFTSGEVDVMRKLRASLDAGGVAFLLIEANLLQDGGDDEEEERWWRRAKHTVSGGQQPLEPTRHSEDDDLLPDHWVVLLDGLHVGEDPSDSQPVSLRVWSWGNEYELSGTVEGLSEYLYAGAWGHP